MPDTTELPETTAERAKLPSQRPAGLLVTAQHQERVHALLDIGLTADELGRACDVTPATVRNWRAGTGVPRQDAERVVDDLRCVATILAEAGLDGPAIAGWLRSRNRDDLEEHVNARPLNLIRKYPLSVLGAAEHFAFEREVSAAEENIKSERLEEVA